MVGIIIAGDRDMNSSEFTFPHIEEFLKRFKNQEITIISGGARGLDHQTQGELYAQQKGLKLEVRPADWNRYGRSADSIRNEEMVKRASALLAFWDGKNPETRNMINLAKYYGLICHVVHYDKSTC